MQRDPITKQRSQWTAGRRLTIGNIPGFLHTRSVSDGELRAIVADEPEGLHLSISFVNRKGQATRYPTWDEIADARDQLLPSNRDFVMHLPATNYVAVHRTTFHLHEHPAR